MKNLMVLVDHLLRNKHIHFPHNFRSFRKPLSATHELQVRSTYIRAQCGCAPSNAGTPPPAYSVSSVAMPCPRGGGTVTLPFFGKGAFFPCSPKFERWH